MTDAAPAAAASETDDTPLGRFPLHFGSTLPGLVQDARRRFADRPALVDHAWGTARRWTHRQAAARTAQLMAALAGFGLRRGAGFSILSPNDADALLATEAGQALGLRYTALHPLASEDDHATILEDAGIAALIAHPARFGARARALKGRVPSLRHLLGLGPLADAEDLIAHADAALSGPWPVVAARPEDIVTLSYTGGTTGRPKGVVHRHRSRVFNVLQAMAEWDWPREVRYLAAAPVSHASGAMIPPVLLKGGSVHLLPGFDPEQWMDIVQRERITAALLVPTMIYALLDHPRRRAYDLSSLEMVVYGAAPIAPARLAQAIREIGPVFCQFYAQVEAPNTITWFARADHDPDDLGRLESCGRPQAGNVVALLDGDGSPVATGEVGEICVRGPLVMEGYWNRPEETAHALRGGWLHTGDMARADEHGFLTIVDRAKDMIVTGGFNVYPREVEDALATHPQVAMAAVIGVPDPKWGEAVTALVVLKPGANTGSEELIALVKERKGSVYAPKTVEFVDALPVTALGKLDKKAVRARFWQGQGRQVG